MLGLLLCTDFTFFNHSKLSLSASQSKLWENFNFNYSKSWNKIWKIWNLGFKGNGNGCIMALQQTELGIGQSSLAEVWRLGSLPFLGRQWILASLMTEIKNKINQFIRHTPYNEINWDGGQYKSLNHDISESKSEDRSIINILCLFASVPDIMIQWGRKLCPSFIIPPLITPLGGRNSHPSFVLASCQQIWSLIGRN